MKTQIKTVTLVQRNNKEAEIEIDGDGWKVLSHSRYDGQGTFTTGYTWHTLVLAREIEDVLASAPAAS
jgi:hypothetical protein